MDRVKQWFFRYWSYAIEEADLESLVFFWKYLIWIQTDAGFAHYKNDDLANACSESQNMVSHFVYCERK